MNIEAKILEVLNEEKKPLLDVELARVMNIEKSQIHIIRDILDDMEKSGYVIKTKKGKYGPPESFDLIRGKIQITAKGFGFLIPDNKSLEDIFIAPTALNGAMNMDEVFVKVTKISSNDRKMEGEVERILVRKNEIIVGTFEKNPNFGFVVPDDKRIRTDIFVAYDNMNEAKHGQKVVVKIYKWPKDNRSPEGKVIEVLGNPQDPGVDVRAIIKTHGLREEFPSKVLEEADAIETTIPESEKLRRRDLSNHLIVTIDGIDAKDLDDAVNVIKLENGNYKLGVHIADVAHYVREYNKIDKEALLRATSVYLLDRVLPMLPKKLSNEVCSLNPNVPRLTLSCEMEIDKNGKIIDHDIFESIIESKYRLNYDEVSDLLEKGIVSEKLKPIENELKVMEELSKILYAKRELKGSIDFDFAESKIILDENFIPIEISKRDRRIGNRIIEEFMLIANETVASHYYWLEIPFLYRIHEHPLQEKIDEFNKFLNNFGYRIKGSSDEIHPKAVQELIREVKGKKEEHIINKLMLRALKQAKYSDQEEGHFGLAAEYYSHFTSPIRRYPDLQIHRIIKEHLNGLLSEKRLEHYKKILPEVATQSSEMERTAEKVERDVEDLMMAIFMKDKIGEEYEGIVSSVTSFGMFIELENTVEGLVRLVELTDDYYRYDDKKLELYGTKTNKIYKIGDTIKVLVSNVSILNREISFTVVGD
jgi:ribonuclease R